MRIGPALVSILPIAAIAAIAACRPPGYGKGGDDDGTPDAGKRDAAVDAAATTCEHAFRLDNHAGASSVWLTGTFTMWGGDPDHGAIPLAFGVDGGWTVSRMFDPGVHQYKFVVDGSSWIPDPANPNMIDDGFGGKNSLYTCAP